MPTRNPGPEEVFHQARGIDSPGERDAYLRGACGDNLALRSKVEALLRAEEEAGRFLASASHAWGSSDEANPHEPLGSLIGRYKLLQEIGEGGFGVVYLAEQKEPVKRRVALKVIKLGMDTRQVIARFEAERQALAMMDHAHIAMVLDAGATDSGRPYFVMELVKGIAITEYCDQNHLTVQERLGLFAHVCNAVQHAHQKGIIHRDIKPSNVLVTLHDGVPVPKVIDFGIAKATSAELTEKTLFTEHGQMIGTPLYMSPEQAEMSGLDIDTRSDIYSLGVLLYELLTGTTPVSLQDLRGAGYGEMQRIIREREAQKPSTRLSTLDALPSIASHRGIEPRKLGSLIQGDLDWIIMKALEKDRTRRYETPAAFAADLGRFLADEPVLASPPSSAYRLRKFVRRNRKSVSAGAFMAVMLLAALGVSIHFGASEARQRRTADRNSNLAEQRAAELQQSNEQRAAETERAERLSYSAFLHAAQAQLDDGNIRDAKRLHARCPEPLRNWEWHHLGLSLDQSLHALEVHGSAAQSLAWSPAGKRFVSGFNDGTLRIWDAASGEPLQTLEGHAKYVRSVAWSPDGERIASGASDDNPRIWSATSGECLQVLEGHEGGVWSVAWSPDGTRIASGAESDKTLRIWDALSGELLQQLEGGLRGMVSVAWSPDGTSIVSGSWRQLQLWDAVSAESLWVQHREWMQVLSLTWSPDGQRIASAGGDEALRIWDAASGENVESLVWPGHTMGSLAWSPDGARILSSALEHETLRIWDVVSGENLQTLNGHAGDVAAVAWSPDGTRILSSSMDETLRLWDAASGGSHHILEARGYWVGSVDWSPDGTRIASSGSASTFRAWDVASGFSTRITEGLGTTAIWSPDWTRIVASGEEEETLHIWNAEADEEPRTLNGNWPMAWSPDGKRIVSAGADAETLRIWDVESGEVLRTLHGHRGAVTSVAWSPDGTRLVSGSMSTVRIWDAQRGECLRTLEGHGSDLRTGHASTVRALAWSPDGKRVVSGSEDTTLHIWDATSGAHSLTLVGHRGPVESVAWSPDGTRIVSGSADDMLRIWDAENGESLMTLAGHGDDVTSVSWSPDGKRIVSSGSNDCTLRIWESRREDATPLWHAADQRRQISPLVNSLFEEHVLLAPVLSALRAERSLPPDLQEAALRLARSRGNPTLPDINNHAWELVSPDRDKKNSDVALGLRLVRAAIELGHDGATARDTLAWALLANVLYDDAVAESEKALELAPEENKVQYRANLERLRAEVARLRHTNTPSEEADTQER